MHASNWLARIKRIVPDLIVVIAFLIAGLKYTSGISEIVDIGLADETAYLMRGIAFLRLALPTPENAPLYAVWYSLLARVSPDRIGLYYLNYIWVTILPPVLFYILLRRFQVSLITSSLFALFLLITNANFAVWPKVNHFALIVLLVFLILATIPKSFVLSSAIVALGCLAASYVRPELYYAFAICFAISAVIFFFRERTLLNAAALGCLVLIAVSVGLTVGFPVGGEDRSLVAFGQHFSMNWLAWTNYPGLSPWTDWQQILEMNFGKVTGIGDAVSSNPSLFARHVLTNAMNLPRALFATFAPHANLFLPYPMRLTEMYLLPALVIAGIVLYRKTILSRMPISTRTESRLLFLTGVICLVLILAILIIFPRAHYMVILGTLLLAVVAVVIDPFKDREINAVRAIVIALIVIAISPSAVNLMGPLPRQRPTLQAIQFLRGLRVTETTRLLDADLGYSSYLSGNFTSIPPYQKSKPFYTFIREQKINMIMESENLLNDSRFRDDKEWKAFQENYESAGFVKLALPDGKRALYVDESILPPTN